MKKLLYKFIIGICMTSVLAGCYQAQEVAQIDGPENNPSITITPLANYSSVTEGDTMKFTVATSGMVTHAIAFSVNVDAASETNDADIQIINTTLNEFTESFEVWVVAVEDNFPENSESLSFTITPADDMAWNFQLSNPSEELTVSTTIINKNDPDALTVGFIWDDPAHVIDFDLLVEHAALGSWSADGATGNNPEIDNSIRLDYADPYDGTYYVGVDPYSVPDGDVNFSVHVGYPDGTVEFYEGTWNNGNSGNYTTDEFSAWGIDMYRMLVVEKTGSNFDVTFDF